LHSKNDVYQNELSSRLRKTTGRKGLTEKEQHTSTFSLYKASLFLTSMAAQTTRVSVPLFFLILGGLVLLRDLRQLLTQALTALADMVVMDDDAKLDNFHLVGDKGKDKIMVVDLELVDTDLSEDDLGFQISVGGLMMSVKWQFIEERITTHFDALVWLPHSYLAIMSAAAVAKIRAYFPPPWIPWKADADKICRGNQTEAPL
jgi:hypothetical protein